MQIDALKVDEMDTIVLTFNENTDVDVMQKITKIWQDTFHHNLILANRTDLIQNITIIKKDDISLW